MNKPKFTTEKNTVNKNGLSDPLSYRTVNIPGMETKTTIANDFAIAEHFGTDAIADTFNNLVNTFLGSPDKMIEYWIEFIFILNTLCWHFYNNKNEYWQLYADMYHAALNYYLDAAEHCKNKEVSDKMIKMYYRFID